MRILLVEDNLSLAEGLVTLLRQSGYAVDVVHDGASAEALALAESFDLVILDLNLPQMDGLEVLRKMRARKNPAAVMILTARSFSLTDQPLDLPARERGLLELLIMRAGKVVARESIIQSLTSLEDDLSANAIEQYVSRLRKRLAPAGLTVRTARGIGYFLDRTDR